MAKTAATGFYPRKHLYGTEHAATIDTLLAASATVKIGDLVRVNTSGYLVRAETGTCFAGVLVGIVDQNGVNVFSPRASGTTGATLSPDDTIVTASTNVSDATKQLKGQVIIDPAGATLFYNNADTALAQTNLFQFFDAAAGSQVTTGSASDANGQVQLMQIDPDGDGTTTKGLFRFNETQFNAGLDTATAKNAA
jgi:hypothetical protein